MYWSADPDALLDGEVPPMVADCLSFVFSGILGRKSSGLNRRYVNQLNARCIVVRVKYSLEEFTHDMDGLIDGGADQETLFDKGSGYLERLINDPEAVPEAYRSPSGTGARANHGSYVLYHGDNGLLVTSVVWGAGDHLGPHDHRTWGIIGVLGNSITETRFRRVDDRQREGYARLEKDRVADVKSGEISLLIPEVDEIHQMDNFSDRSTVEIHVYGNDLRGLERSKFDLETGEVTLYATQRFDNC